MKKIEDILLGAKNEILTLRRENEVLAGKVRTMDGLLGLFYGKSSSGGLMANHPDPVQEIGLYLRDLELRLSAAAT